MVNWVASWNYLVGQDVDVVSHVFGFDLTHKTVLVLIALQTLRVGLLHDIHLRVRGQSDRRLPQGHLMVCRQLSSCVNVRD